MKIKNFIFLQIRLYGISRKPDTSYKKKIPNFKLSYPKFGTWNLKPETP
jgi:hypothetical protein